MGVERKRKPRKGADPGPARSVVPGLTFRLVHDNRIGIFGVNGTVPVLHLNKAVLRGTEAFLRHACHVIVDFTNATSLDATRIGFLAFGQTFVRKRRRQFALVAPREKEVFQNLPVDMAGAFTIHPDVEAAVAAILKADPKP